MGLDARGDVSVVELFVYIPVQIISILLVIRLRKFGWVYLVLLSTIRIVGAATHIASELSTTPNKVLHIIFGVMESSGLAQLLLAALGLIGMVKEHGFEDERRLHVSSMILHVFVHVALFLSIVGGVKVGNGSTVAAVNSGISWRHVGAIMFLINFLLIVSVIGFLWQNKQRILMHRRTLLLAVTVSLSFLTIRLAYAVCSAYAPTGFPGAHPGDSHLASFNSITGSFAVYLIMSVITEMAVVAIYIAAGWFLPLQKDYASSAPPGVWRSDSEDDIKLVNNAQTDVYAARGQGSTAYVPQYR